MFPSTLHLRQGTFVRFIPACDRFLEMVILRFYNLIGSLSMEREITWSTQLFTCHCLHRVRFLSQYSSVNLGRAATDERSRLNTSRSSLYRWRARSPGGSAQLLDSDLSTAVTLAVVR
jgi:hypothetical protein